MAKLCPSMTKHRQARRLVGWLGILPILWSGCGTGSRLQTFPVTGTVTLDGQPVADADVVFIPSAGSQSQLACQAVTDAEGRYEVSTHAGRGKYQPGMQSGVYEVEVLKLGAFHPLRPPPNLLPARYASRTTSGLRLEVAQGPQTYDIQLSSP